MARKKMTGGAGWSLGPPSDAPVNPPDAPSPPNSAGPGKAVVRVEKRPRGKVVTVVTGLAFDPEGWRALAKRLKAACGAGGAATDTGLEIQGDMRERVIALLK